MDAPSWLPADLWMSLLMRLSGDYADSWFLGLPFVVAELCVLGWGAWRLEARCRVLDSELRTDHDLARIENAINEHIRQTVLFIGVMAVFLGALLLCHLALKMSFGHALSHFWAFILAPAPLWIVRRRFRERLMRLSTESASETARRTYARWLAEWQHPRWRLRTIEEEAALPGGRGPDGGRLSITRPEWGQLSEPS